MAYDPQANRRRPKPADTENTVKEGLLDLNVADVVVLDFGTLSVEDSARPDGPFVRDR